MLAIVVTLGGYFVGLHWLLNPPDPWQPSPKIAQSNAQFGAKKRLPPAVKPAESGAGSELTAAAEPDIKSASIETNPANIETPASVQTSENATARPTEHDVVGTRPIAAPAHILRHEAPAVKPKPGNRKRIERTASRKLELMVLRTYERSDGKRFTRLLPLSGARSALAFQPEDPW
jgi:hypothetical protein